MRDEGTVVVAPRWAILRVYGPGGQMQEAKPKYEPPKPQVLPGFTHLPAVYQPRRPPCGPLNCHVRVPQNDMWNVAGNLPSSEYQFWVGNRQEGSFFSRCRYCYAFCVGPLDRKRHQERGLKHEPTGYHESCARRLQLAGKVLLRKGRCLVCNEQTIKQKWGFPLCSPKCVFNWKFTWVDHPLLDEVLGPVQDRMNQRTKIEDAALLL